MDIDGLQLLSLSMAQANNQISFISQNLANINSNNYKNSKLNRNFLSYLDSANPISSVVTDYSAGSLNKTGNKYDIALSENTYLSVLVNGESMLSRGGSLYLDAAGKLLTHEGYVVQGDSGDIYLPINSEPVITEKGEIMVGGKLFEQLQLYQVSGSHHPSMVKLNLYLQDGEVLKEPENIAVRQGYVETSNTNAADEMVGLIKTMRHFEAHASLVKTYDDMVSGAISSLGKF